MLHDMYWRLHTLYWNFNTSPVVEYVLRDLSLQNETLSLETKRVPSIAPAVVYMQHREACTNFSQSLVPKVLLKIFPSRPS